MVNFNGQVIDVSELKISNRNRALAYGDGIFDTLKFEAGSLVFVEDHYFRLMSSMRMLRMKIPMNFTLEFYESEIMKLIEHSGFQEDLRIRVTVYRKDGGLYLPLTNEIDYLIEVRPLTLQEFDVYEIELYKDFPVVSSLLSTIKSNNRLLNVLASVYADENSYQNCLLINEKKNLVEAINSNVFLIKGKDILTPSIESGCVNGIIRKKIIGMIQESDDYILHETAVSPFELLKADEVFLTNSITEIQSIHKYRKRNYQTTETNRLKDIFVQKYKVKN
jgi:branched-chain amino acid aminotransferase